MNAVFQVRSELIDELSSIRNYVTNNIKATLPTWISEKVLPGSDDDTKLEIIGARVGDFKEKNNQIGHLFSQVQHKHTQLLSVTAALEKLQISLNREGERGEEFSEALKTCVRTEISKQHVNPSTSQLFTSFAEVHNLLNKEANLRNFKWSESVTQPLQDCVAYLERMEEVVSRYQQYKAKFTEELKLLKQREQAHHGINQQTFTPLDQQRTIVSEIEKIFVALREELLNDGKEVYEGVVRQTEGIKQTVAEIEEGYTQRVATIWRDFMSKNPGLSIET